MNGWIYKITNFSLITPTQIQGVLNSTRISPLKDLATKLYIRKNNRTLLPVSLLTFGQQVVRNMSNKFLLNNSLALGTKNGETKLWTAEISKFMSSMGQSLDFQSSKFESLDNCVSRSRRCFCWANGYARTKLFADQRWLINIHSTYCNIARALTTYWELSKTASKKRLEWWLWQETH